MWTFILIYILGINLCQTTVQDNSTQMYYVTIKIEQSAIPNVTKILKPFVNHDKLNVDNLQITTICQNDSDSLYLCTCDMGHKWSDKVCETHPKCCGKERCQFSKPSNYMCVSNSSVTLSGNVILRGLKYSNCLQGKLTEKFKTCDADLKKEIKTVYSTLKGFDSLAIIKYSIGSIIASFEMTLAFIFTPKELLDKSINLAKILNSSFDLETRDTRSNRILRDQTSKPFPCLPNGSMSFITDYKGVVKLSMPPNPVHYNSQQNIRCTTQQDMLVQPIWHLTRGNQVFDITQGTESKIQSYTLETNIALSNTSELWAGEYACEYHVKEEKGKISHKASGVMDVCLKPNIDISLPQGFPHCQNSNFVNVAVKCEIQKSNENVIVKWSGQNTRDIRPAEKSGVFFADTYVSCDPKEPKPKLTCSFTNRCNQTTDASIDINIIFENDRYCAYNGDWKKTKAGFTAKLKCEGKVGERRRKCNNGTSEGVWQPEVSDCVDHEVNSVLENAMIVDIGLGSLNQNAERVLVLLANVSSDLKKMDTFSNLNTSISVLVTLSQKLPTQQEAVMKDFMESSSNLLDESLSKSWETNEGENSTLAERYLSSVEQLIHSTNITQSYGEKNVAIESQNCSKEPTCIKNVFNNTVDLKGRDPGSVKTAAFKELGKYLPNKRDEYKPNSIVVSTTTERKISDSVQVHIKFQLLEPRPRNYDMMCASWDNNTRSWSTYKCEWKWEKGSEGFGVCVCEHLSSFAILMARYPLEVRWLTEITYVGLAVSVISLVISLVIEVIVWGAVVKTNSLHLRHTAHVNICLSLLVADCCFLASSKPDTLSSHWCKTFAVLKHFCYLAMFFWMLWLSSALLHQTMYLFQHVSKKKALKLSFAVGYVCPLLIVIIAFLANKAGAEGHYYSKDTCWLVYTSPFKGSIHTFVIPIGTIVFFNIFAMLMVIWKLLDHSANKSSLNEKDKKAVVTVVRTVIILTPIFGVTWIFGFAVISLDLSSGTLAYIANYAFTLMNAFQGLYILLTTVLGDQVIQEELLKRLKRKAPASTNESFTDSTMTISK